MIPLGPWTPDVPVQGNSVEVAKNVLPGPGYYRPFQGLAVNTTALDAPCRGAIAAQAKNGTTYAYAADATKLYRLVDGTWTSAATGLTSDEFTEFARWGETVISVNGHTDAPQDIALGGTSFAALGGSPPKAKHLAVVGDFVMLGNLLDYPNRVQWSSINNSEEWTPGTNQGDYQDFPSGGAVQRVLGGEYGIVFQETSIRRLTYVGSPIIFTIDEVEPGRGTQAPQSVVQFGNLIFYYGLDGFFAFNGQNSIPIGHAKVDRWFLEYADSSRLHLMSGAIDPSTGRVRWAFASSGSSYNDTIIVYDIKQQQWTYAGVDTEYVFQSRTVSTTLEGLDDLYTSIDDIPGSLDDDIYIRGLPYMAAFDLEHKLGYFNGPNLAGVIETGEHRLSPGRSSRVRGVEPVLEGDCAVQVGVRDTKQDAVEWTEESLTNGYGVCDFNVEARYHRARLLPQGEWDYLQGMEIDATARGRR